MAWYEYRAVTRGGTLMAGRVEAPDHDRAMAELVGIGLEVRELNESSAPKPGKGGISSEDLIFFNEQLASLAEAGIALDDGLAQLARDVESPHLRRWIQGLVEDLRRGIALDEAIAARESGLPVLYSRVVKAGIETGELPATLLNLNQHLRFAGATRRIMWETLSYPLLVATLAVLIASFFFIMLVPQFEEIFADFDTRLPGLTLFMLYVSHLAVPVLLIAALALLAIMVTWRLMRLSKSGRAVRESVLSNIPVIGRIHRASLIARFFRAVSTAIATGIPLPSALRLGAGATGSGPLISDADFLATEVEQGKSVFVANQSTSIIPPLFGFCVQTAAGRDALPQAIDKLAHSYESRAVHSQTMLRAILFPLMIIALGCFLGLCILAMFLPLVSLIQCMTG